MPHLKPLLDVKTSHLMHPSAVILVSVFHVISHIHQPSFYPIFLESFISSRFGFVLE
jgi:hypothetical protein